MAGQRIELAPYSMFAQTPLYEVDSNVVFGQMVPAVVSNATDIIYTVPSAGEHRLDLISTQFYGVPDLWWVLAAVNNIIDPLVAVPANTLIRIPNRDRLATEGVLSV
jgi:hypothetical protein